MQRAETGAWSGEVTSLETIIRHDVFEGRAVLNFSEWQRAQEEARKAPEEILEREMPPAMYQLMHAHARLNDADRDWLARGLANTLGRPRVVQSPRRSPAGMTTHVEAADQQHR